MRKLLGLLAAVTFVFVAGVSFSQDAAVVAPATEVAAPAATPVAPAADAAVVAPAADAAVVAPAVAEYTGVVEVTPADVENNETAATIILDLGEQALKLVAGDAAKLAELEKANGKNVTVKGILVPAGEGHLMDMLQVSEWVEAAAPVAPVASEAAVAPVAPAAGE